MSDEKQEQQQDGGDKISKQYEANLKKLVALVGGKDNLKRVNVPNDGLGTIVNELLDERRQEKITEFKAKAKAIIDKKLEFDKEVKKAEEQMKNTVNAKKKEFTDEMVALFKFVEDINEVEQSYYSTLSNLQPGQNG